ncbi:DUF3010 family protein [Shimia thalassica]|uniref:DUF3010 family protein n=1 Tax=Shimia thalassica TaxID=1715693 RepID=UPI002734287C|nr:DUF3010 family protein [Shimia thalassica]MDP2520848.1 DUF3010 family protein [Shimia thalassica]
MRVCGCEISAQEVRVAVVYYDEDGQITKLPVAQTRIEIADDTSDEDLKSCLAEMQAFAVEHEVDTFVIKSRARKGKMAGGPATFKLETLLQLVDGTKTKFVHAATLAAFTKKEIDGYPDKLPVYLKNAYAAGVYGLKKAS